MSLLGDFFTVPRETYNKRLEICDTCEEYNKESKVCKNCGCYMEYKAKLRAVSCPLKKWLREEYKHGAS